MSGDGRDEAKPCGWCESAYRRGWVRAIDTAAGKLREQWPEAWAVVHELRWRQTAAEAGRSDARHPADVRAENAVTFTAHGHTVRVVNSADLNAIERILEADRAGRSQDDTAAESIGRLRRALGWPPSRTNDAVVNEVLSRLVLNRSEASIPENEDGDRAFAEWLIREDYHGGQLPQIEDLVDYLKRVRRWERAKAGRLEATPCEGSSAWFDCKHEAELARLRSLDAKACGIHHDSDADRCVRCEAQGFDPGMQARRSKATPDLDALEALVRKANISPGPWAVKPTPHTNTFTLYKPDPPPNQEGGYWMASGFVQEQGEAIAAVMPVALDLIAELRRLRRPEVSHADPIRVGDLVTVGGMALREFHGDGVCIEVDDDGKREVRVWLTARGHDAWIFRDSVWHRRERATK